MTSSWKTELIRNSFSEEEAEVICNLPINKYQVQDKLVWYPTSTGEFLVRSAYHLEMERCGSMKGECSYLNKNRDLWNCIWKWRIPNAARMFLWRACSNILQTKDNLKRRRVVQEDICFICNRFVETAKHSLWDCPAAQDVWGGIRCLGGISWQ